MEHFIEGFLELLFSFAKSKPKKRPTLEQKNDFVVHYNKVASIISLPPSFLAGTAFLGFSFIMDNDTKVLFIIFSVLFFLTFFLFSFLFSIKYYINKKEIVKQTLFFFKKTILWEDIICLRIIEKTDESEVTIALYGKDKKLALDVSSQMENAWYLVNMAETKQIEVKKEKDLSLKQLSKL